MSEMLLTILPPIIRKTGWTFGEVNHSDHALTLRPELMISADLADVLPFVQGQPLVKHPSLN